MKTILILLLSSGCGTYNPDYYVPGISVFYNGEHKASKKDFQKSLGMVFKYWWETYELTSKRAFERQGGLQVHFQDERVECPQSPEGCAGLTVGDVVTIYLPSKCLGDSALLHELAHALRQRKQGNQDTDHSETMLWHFADTSGPREQRETLEGCKKN